MARRTEKRKHKRYRKKLQTVFKAGDRSFRSFSTDISPKGLFIKTVRGLPPGTLLDIELHLPDDTVSYLKGAVKRSTRTQISVITNGMGVELLDVDDNFKRFLEKEFDERGGPAPHMDPPRPPDDPIDEYIIKRCVSCKVKNKINSAKVSLGPKCGRCGSPL